MNDLKKTFHNSNNINNYKTCRTSNILYDYFYSIFLLKFKSLNLFLNYSKTFLEKINDENFFEIDFDCNLLMLFKKIIIKTIKKLLLYRSKDAFETYNFILNVTNYPKFFSNSGKNLIIYTLISFIFCFLSFHDSKSEGNQNVLNNYVCDIMNLMCDGNNHFNNDCKNDEQGIFEGENILDQNIWIAGTTKNSICGNCLIF